MSFMWKEQKQSEVFEKKEVNFKKIYKERYKNRIQQNSKSPAKQFVSKDMAKPEDMKKPKSQLLSLFSKIKKKILRSRWKFERKNELKSNLKIKYFLKIYSDKHCFVKLIFVLATSWFLPGQIWNIWITRCTPMNIRVYKS